ncbi:MAG: hydantoinase B/oxoprolinase family protein [Arenicellales bacterium]|nr:hydantoinase B/oxoprolinase family protein [Arenicellales bacterium]MDP6393699.1 hydantoinase B/oxoprolinase family protein [Arenicellales bacterium]MDP7221444.1 hydantoinase B/oxoprolinase family protein [Arenicellales bacterium]|tara:strand:- start:14667 stop:16349 length:1683 start_codon:yes stop_codon:yes gene_type:complete
MSDSSDQSNSMATDPVTFEVVKNTLYKAAEEMKIVLAKTAYSPILKLAGDYSCGIFDTDGNMVAQGPDLPIHLGSMPDAVAAVIGKFKGRTVEGDVYIHNDPYFGGSHLPDVNVIAPAFYEDRILGWTCVRAHWPDIGSATPGSYGAVTEIYGEGLRMPPIRLYHGGDIDPNVEDLILANVRTPDERQGDLRAQVAANHRACQRLAELASKYGVDVLTRIMQEVMDYSERLMRLMLSELPDGVGTFEDFCDGDGIIEDDEDEDTTFTIRMQVQKTGDSLEVDFAGSDPAVSGPINAPLSVTASGVYCSLKMIVDPNSLIPPNSGAWRAITVKAPEGSVVNARFPSPVVYANHEISHRVADMTFGAMSSFMPDNVMACSQGTSGIITLGGLDPRNGQRYVSYETIKGGLGARPNKDGINVVAAGISNTMNTPIEILELSFPVRIDYYEITADSGGRGRYRGGCGSRRAWTIVGHDARAAVCLERTKSPPFGVCGGEAGTPASIALKLPDGSERKLLTKGGFNAPAGSQILLEVPGAGGYGDDSDRDPQARASDLLDGYISR